MISDETPPYTLIRPFLDNDEDDEDDEIACEICSGEYDDDCNCWEYHDDGRCHENHTPAHCCRCGEMPYCRCTQDSPVEVLSYDGDVKAVI